MLEMKLITGYLVKNFKFEWVEQKVVKSTIKISTPDNMKLKVTRLTDHIDDIENAAVFKEAKQEVSEEIINKQDFQIDIDAPPFKIMDKVEDNFMIEVEKRNDLNLLILHGSQTGTAQA